jgi:hypothetical protein
MKCPTGVLARRGAHPRLRAGWALGMLVSSAVVEDGVDELAAHHGLDSVEEADEFLMPPAGRCAGRIPRRRRHSTAQNNMGMPCRI